jgi:hypothetical protein
MIDGHTVTIATGSMNRLDHLCKALPTWLARPEADEILIVDWGSEPLLAESLMSFQDRRLRIARVSNCRYWENARCHNLEFRLARGDLLLRLDNDHLLHDDFFAQHPMAPGSFYAGNWRKVPFSESEKRNLSGILWTWREALRTVNGYNERLVHFGVEDDDLYERLAASGLERRDISIWSADHLHHSDVARYRNLRIAAEHPEIVDNSKRSWDECRDDFSVAKRQILEISLQENAQRPWTTRDRMTRWVRRDIDSRFVMIVEDLPGRTVCDGEEVIT